MYVLFFFKFEFFFVRNFVPNDFFWKYFSKIHVFELKIWNENNTKNDSKIITLSENFSLSFVKFLVHLFLNDPSLGKMYVLFFSISNFIGNFVPNKKF